MSDLRDPSGYNIRLASAPPQVVAPAVSKLSSTANLGPGASISFDFSIDQTPFVDAMLLADQNLTVVTLVRIDQTDTFHQIDNNIPYTADITKYARLLDGKRFPGSLFRLTITNPGAVATTVFAAEIQVRSA